MRHLFISHTTKLTSKCRHPMRWILQAFVKKQPVVLLNLWKTLALSRLNYFLQLWSPNLFGFMGQTEELQRTFTYKITSAESLNYWERQKTQPSWIPKREIYHHIHMEERDVIQYRKIRHVSDFGIRENLNASFQIHHPSESRAKTRFCISLIVRCGFQLLN